MASSGRPHPRPSGGAHAPQARQRQRKENWVLRHLPRKPWTASPRGPRGQRRLPGGSCGGRPRLLCSALKCSFSTRTYHFNYKGSETFDWGSNADSANPRTVWLLASHSITLNVLLSVKTNSHHHLTGLSRHRRRKDESTQPHGARRVAAAGYTARTNRSVRVGGLLTPFGFRLATFQTASPRAPTLCAQQSCSSHSSSRARLSADRSVRMSYKRALEEEAGVRQALSEAGRQQGWHSLLGQTAET